MCAESARLTGVNTRVDHLIEEALALAPDERSAVVVALLDSLDGDDEIEVTKAWADEVERRRHELRSGAAQSIPWTEAHARLKAL